MENIFFYFKRSNGHSQCLGPVEPLGIEFYAFLAVTGRCLGPMRMDLWLHSRLLGTLGICC